MLGEDGGADDLEGGDIDGGMIAGGTEGDSLGNGLADSGSGYLRGRPRDRGEVGGGVSCMAGDSKRREFAEQFPIIAKEIRSNAEK